VLRCARIPRGCLLAAALGMAVSGCSSALKLSGLDEQQPLLTTATAPATSATARLQAGEQISVTVYGEASLSGNYLIDPSGIVSIPLAGKIKAAGLTTTELADILVKKFRSQYLKDPKVTVSVAEVRGF
jgi:protein involved in polysaccharide export with SLBB domain